MSVTYGFYNSLNGDRKYNAEQVSSMFDGVIKDGIFTTIGTNFAVNASSELNITVGTGKAWFNNTWTINDSVLTITLPMSEQILDRVDAVVIEVNKQDTVRENSIKIVTGTPSSSPERPTLTNSETVHQYALAYIYRKASSDTVAQTDITSVVGTAETPWVEAFPKAPEDGLEGLKTRVVALEEKAVLSDQVDKVIYLSQSEYDAIATKDTTVMYCIYG